MKRKLHVAAAQIHSGGGRDDIFSRMERQVLAATAVDAEVLLFPECVLHGYDYDMTPASVRSLAETFDGTSCRFVRALAVQRKICLLAGFFEEAQGHVYNSVLIARPDNTYSVTRKHYLAPCDENAKLTPSSSSRRDPFELNGVRCALVICADAGISGLHDNLRADGVELRFCPTGGGGRLRDMLHEDELDTPQGQEQYRNKRGAVFVADAILDANLCPDTAFVSANALGPVGAGTCHQGHCMIADRRRVLRAQIPGTVVLEHMQDQMIHAELSF